MIGVFEIGGKRAELAPNRWIDLFKQHAFKAAIFDCDGTLVDSAEAHFQAFRSAAMDQNFDLRRGWYLERTGLDRRTLFHAFRDSQAPDLDIEKAIASSISAYAREVRRVAPIAQTSTLLHQLNSAGIPIAVGTNSERIVATHSLNAIGIGHLVSAIACVSDTLAPKPAPDIFRAAAAMLGMPPSDILVVEDSDEGVRAARAADMAVLQIVRT